MDSTVSAGDGRSFVYLLDAEDRIHSVNDEWLAFARENDAPELTAENVVGRLVWDYIADSRTSEMYHQLLNRLREHNASVRYSYRCDSPDCRRFLQMHIQPQPDGALRFESRIERIEPRRPVEALRPSLPTAPGLLSICSMCKRVKAAGPRWLEIERAIEELRTFGGERSPSLAHSICPDCQASMAERCARLTREAETMQRDLENRRD